MSRTLQVTRHFAGQLEAVFDLCSDLEHAAENVSGIVRIEVLTDGPVGVGTRWRETRIVLGKEGTEEMEITSFERPHGYTVECTSHGAHFVSRFAFRPSGEGTEVALHFSAEAHSLAARLMVPMMMGTVHKCVEQDFADLEAALERRAATGAD